MLDWNTRLVYISQSGTSGEVIPLIERLQPNNRLVAITNNPSTICPACCHRAAHVCRWREHLVASKTYANTLGDLVAVSAPGSRDLPPCRLPGFGAYCGPVEPGLSQAAQIQQTMQALLDVSQPLLFTGHGPHAATSRQAAMLLSEWAGIRSEQPHWRLPPWLY